MKRHFLTYIFNLEYLAVAVFTLLAVFFFFQLTNFLADYNVEDSTSPLNPIASRIEFININDVSIDAIFAIKDLRESNRHIAVVNLNKAAPTPDNDIAALLAKLRYFGARAVGIDVLFDRQHFERFPDSGTAEIANLRAALRDNPATVLAAFVNTEAQRAEVLPLPELREGGARIAFVNLERDPDLVIRRYYPYLTVDSMRMPAMAVELARLYNPKLVEPLAGLTDESQFIHYRGTWMQFTPWDIATVLERDDLGPVFKDRIVLVGLVNEGGLAYVDDTYMTPLGRKTVVGDEVGMQGPDMPGVLIHANILNMILAGEFITPVPVWLDWLIALVLIYCSYALYRMLRTKASSNAGVGILITATLISESVIVFFLPILAFFYLGVKVSYNIMATGVLLFIPAGAIVTRWRFRVLQHRMRSTLRASPSPARGAILLAFDDSEPVPAHVRLDYAALVLLAVASAEQCALRRERGEAPPDAAVPGIDEWRALIPEIRAALDPGARRRTETAHLLYYLHGKKDQFLRDSAMKDFFFTSQLKGSNENFLMEEWEVLLPYVRELFADTLRAYLGHPLRAVERDGDAVRSWDPATGAAADGLPEGVPPDAAEPGVYLLRSGAAPLPLSPWCEYAECKLHRTRELFVFAGMLAKQHGLEPLPAYFGSTVCCDPVLPPWTLPRLRALPQLQALPRLQAPDGVRPQPSPITVARNTP